MLSHSPLSPPFIPFTLYSVYSTWYSVVLSSTHHGTHRYLVWYSMWNLGKVIFGTQWYSMLYSVWYSVVLSSTHFHTQWNSVWVLGHKWTKKVDRWVDRQVDGRTDRRTDRRTDGHPPNDPECPQTLFPLEYSAVSPLFLSRINTHTETNTASANAGCKHHLRPWRGRGSKIWHISLILFRIFQSISDWTVTFVFNFLANFWHNEA